MGSILGKLTWEAYAPSLEFKWSLQLWQSLEAFFTPFELNVCSEDFGCDDNLLSLILSDLFRGLSDLHLGNQKVTRKKLASKSCSIF